MGREETNAGGQDDEFEKTTQTGQCLDVAIRSRDLAWRCEVNTLKSCGLFILGILMLNFPVLAKEGSTMGGHSFEQLAECYANNWAFSNVQFSFIQLNDEDTRTYKVFLIEPLSVDVGKESFPNCSFLRFFYTSDIVHRGVSAFVVVLKDKQHKYLMTDKQVEEFLQTAGRPVETEDDFKAFMMTFAQLRVYDIIYKNPIQNAEPNTYQTYDRQYPDSEWGVFVHTSASGALNGHITVVLGPYTSVLRRYDFELTTEKRLKLVKTRDLYCGNPIR